MKKHKVLQKEPKVSVLMSVHNGEPHLREAVTSILDQSFSDFEFLIVDDASEDNTAKILSEYAICDKRIRLIKNAQNIGLTKSLNEGLALAKGEYVARMDADDISLPDRLARQIFFLDKNREVGVTGSAVRIIDAAGHAGETIHFPESHNLLKWFLGFFYNPIAHPSVVMRRAPVNEINGYDESCSTSQDYDLWCRISAITHLCNMPEVLVLLRKHPMSVSNMRYVEQEKNALMIGTNFIRKFYSERVRDEHIVSMWKMTFHPETATKEDIRQSSEFIRQMVLGMLRSEELSREEKRKIKEDVDCRFEVLTKHGQFKGRRHWRILLNAYFAKRSCN